MVIKEAEANILSSLPHMQINPWCTGQSLKVADLLNDGELLRHILFFASYTASLSLGYWVPVTLGDVCFKWKC